MFKMHKACHDPDNIDSQRALLKKVLYLLLRKEQACWNGEGLQLLDSAFIRLSLLARAADRVAFSYAQLTEPCIGKMRIA
jgi:hypothetical protein